MRLGPDAHRYLIVATGGTVPRPFNGRRLLPWLCGTNIRRWWAVYLASWPVAAAGLLAWRVPLDGWPVALAACALLLGLPGILGPSVVIPVGVDLPATALGLVGAWLIADGHPARTVAGVFTICIAASIKETTPVWVALWCWSPWPLIALVVPAVVQLLHKPGRDTSPHLQRIADHPVRTALEHHKGRWRDGWLLVAPWGVTLAALYEPDWRLLVVLAVAHGQLLIATDTVRLVQHAAGVPMAIAAAQVLPTEWLLLAVVAHTFWLRTPERI